MGWRTARPIRYADWLESRERPLFEGQSRVDQQHAFQVAGWLLARGHHDRILIRAALLHDIGKAGPRITVPHRIAWVISGYLGNAARQVLASRWRAFQHLANHPRIGGTLLQSADSDLRVVALVAGHPLPADVERMRLLRQADDAI